MVGIFPLGMVGMPGREADSVCVCVCVCVCVYMCTCEGNVGIKGRAIFWCGKLNQNATSKRIPGTGRSFDLG